MCRCLTNWENQRRMQNYKLQLTLALPGSSCARRICLHSHRVKPCFFTTQLTTDVEVPFDKNVWNKCKAMQKGRLFSDDCWRNEVIEGLKETNIVCSFAFKRHCVTLRHNESKQQVLFRCEGYCTFSTCKVTFSCYINKHFQLYAKFEGTVLHLKSETLAVTSVDLIAKQRKKCWNTNYHACITWKPLLFNACDIRKNLPKSVAQR